MKIGIDASGTFGWRGPSRNILNLIRALIKLEGKNEYYLFASRESAFELPPKNNYQWITVEKKKFVPWLNVSLPISIQRHKLDIFIFPQANFWIWKPTRTIVLTRACKIEHWEDTLSDRLQANIQRKRFNHIADRVGAVSYFNATQIQLTCGIPEEKFEIINNGVDPIFFDQDIPPFTEYGEYILFAGGTEARKNISRLIDAFGIVISRGRSERLVLVGGNYAPSEPQIAEYLSKIRDLGLEERIVLHGVETDTRKMASLYRGASVVVYPSLQEDFGMVSVEAMACGVPLVASNAPSIPEIAGDAAIYFDPYDTQEMADKIEKVLIDKALRETLIARGRERVEKYSWENSAKKLLNLLESVVNSKK